MQWLTPTSALVAAAIAVPLLLLLYFLKLKRREQIVSSTLLWKRAVQDLQVNAPFQRLRRNILLLLQLLMLLAILLAIAGPVLDLRRGRARRHVLLIDRSASMGATDVEPSRLEQAKKEARTYVESLPEASFFSLGGSRNQTMVVAFDSHAKVMCNFTADKRQLTAAIESIQQGDGDSALSEAITVAQAFAQAPGDEPANQSARQAAKMVLFSDGRIADLDEIMVNTEELTFRCIGDSADNIAITAMQARRSYENPEEVEVFATLANYGREAITTDVQLGVNDDVRSVKSVTVPPARGGGPQDGQAGKVAVTFALSYPGAALLEVRQLHQDALGCDDAAWSVLVPPRRLKALLVSEGNMVLELALKACPLARLDVISPDRVDANGLGGLNVAQRYDLVVLDDYVPADLPRCRYLVFGRPPRQIGISVSQGLEKQVVVDWRPNHAVLKYVDLANFFAEKCYKLDLPRDAEVLAEFNEAPALALLRRKGSVLLLAPFDVQQTTWPFEPGFVLFCYNAVAFLGMQVTESQRVNLEVAEPIVLDGLAPGTQVRVDGPGFTGAKLIASPAGSARFVATDRSGVYRVAVAGAEPRFFAVNILDERESNIRPVRQITVSGRQVQAEQSAVKRANVPLWPFLVATALLLACIEWLIYNNKVRI